MVKKINLALQGGGAHGAFTWGVLDRFLEDETVEVAAISGTSAGALNGAAFKAGLLAGGRAGAKANLDWLWTQMGALNDLRMANWMAAMTPAAGMVSRMFETAMPFSMTEAASRVFSPYAYGAAYRNPLTRIAERFHYDKVCSADGPALFVSATNVRTGKIRVFSGQEINTDVLLASACLPTVFQAIELVDPATGTLDAFWDGGYTGNPALFPLFRPELPDDVVIVNINPLERNTLPNSVAEIQNRINEISFNTSLLRELRSIDFVNRLLADGALQPGTMKDILIHMISDDALMNELSVATKMLPSPIILHRLKAAGRAAAEVFLDRHYADLNQRASVDLGQMFR